jgi:hypothetical protein
MGIPGVAIVAPGFEKLARHTGYSDGVPALGVATYPGVFAVETTTDLAKKTAESLIPQIIQLLTKPVVTAEPTKAESFKKIIFTGTVDEVSKYFSTNNWSDGLAIIPPTIERVEEFLKYTDLPPDEKIAVLQPSNLRATPWNIAVNAVMAGCRPEYMPILISTVEAIGDKNYNLSQLGTTGGANPFLILNGPLARQLDIDHGQGLISYQSNQVIGRALGLIVRNIANFRIRESYMSTFGYVQPFVLVEDEEETPWEPYHVQIGFNINVSTVTAYATVGWGPQTFLAGQPEHAKSLMEVMAFDLAYNAPQNRGRGPDPSTTSRATDVWGPAFSLKALLISPSIAKTLAAGGYTTKESLIEDLVKNARKDIYVVSFFQTYGQSRDTCESVEENLQNYLNDHDVKKMKLPWFRDEIETIPCMSKEKFLIVVCGDRGRNKAQTMSNFAVYQRPTIKEIKLPKNWDALMAKLGYPPLKEFFIKKLTRIL